MEAEKKFSWKAFPFILVSLLFFAVGIFSIAFAFADLETMKVLVREDEVIENIQAVLYLLGACMWILVIYAAFKIKGEEKQRYVFHILFFLIFLLFFLEEISWGQRLFGISTPEALEEVNMQDETTVHNIGIENSLLWFFILLGLFLSMVGIVFPVLKLGVKRVERIFERLKFPVVNQNLIACFAMTLVFYSNPGFHWFIPLFIAAIFFPVVIILSGSFKDFFSHFEHPLLQFSLVAVLGLLIVGINLNTGTADHLSDNIAFEIRELLMAMALFFFAFFEARDAWTRKNRNNN